MRAVMTVAMRQVVSDSLSFPWGWFEPKFNPLAPPGK